MGKAVKTVTAPIRSLTKSVGIDAQKDLFDPMRGKYQVAEDYKVNEAAFQDTAQQAAFNEALRQQSLGQGGPTIAQQQLQRGTDRTVAQLAGSAAGARGPNQSLAMREALRAQAAAGQEAASQAALLRAGEMQAAQQAYAQDLARQQASRQGMEQLKANIRGQTQQLQTAANLNQQQQQKDLINKGAQAAMQLFSDEKMKKNVKSLDIKDLAKKIKAVEFEYKQPNGESYQDGTVTGVMAQDLEKSKLGKKMVSENTKGQKMIDLKKAVPVTLAAVSEIIKKIEKLEKKA